MKKFVFIVATILTVFCFAGCGSPKEYDASDTPVLGEWEVTEAMNYDIDYEIDMIIADDDEIRTHYSTLTFYEDGTYEYTHNETVKTGIFEMSDDNLSCTLYDEESEEGILAVLLYSEDDEITWIEDDWDYTYLRK